MDPELERQLRLQRQQANDFEQSRARDVANANRLIQDFVGAMQHNRIEPMPIFAVHTNKTLGKDRLFFSRPTVEHNTYEPIAAGWPIAPQGADSTGPVGYLDAPVITTHRTLARCSWSQMFPGQVDYGTRVGGLRSTPDYNARKLTVNTPQPGMISQSDRMFFLRAHPPFEDRDPVDFWVTPQNIAAALRHYTH